MSDAIFISYRRDDSEGEAGRLYDDLIRVFGTQNVFMDVSDIHPGKDFRRAIDDNVAQCAVLLAVIGPSWTTVKDDSGTRRLDLPNDFVRLEITSALARGIDVIPVLVHGARMPAPAELPEALQNLAFRNCVELTHTRWNSDVELLSRALRDYVEHGKEVPTVVIRRSILGTPTVETAAVQAAAQPTAPAQPPPANQQKSTPEAPPQRLVSPLRAVIWMLVIAAAALVGAAGYIVIHHSRKHHKDKDNPTMTRTLLDQTEAAAMAFPVIL
jgi:hypothetical protein